MKYVFDIDGTLTVPMDPLGNHLYEESVPDLDVIKEVNRLYDEGHEITLFTARGASSGKNWHNLTLKQLTEWGVKYHELIDNGKPSWDIFIDDKAINADDWRKLIKKKKIGFVASAFDLLHPGHCMMLKDAKEHCDILVAALHSDPSIERPEKNKPIMTAFERQILLMSNRYVDKIVLYNTEKELEELLRVIAPDIRVVGSDYKGNEDKITGKQYCKEIYFHERKEHGWSSSHFRERIKKS